MVYFQNMAIFLRKCKVKVCIFLRISIAADGSASGRSARVIYAGGRKINQILYYMANCQVMKISLYKAQSFYEPTDYMASCHVAMEYRLRLHNQGPGRIFLTEDLHPALRLPDCSTSCGVEKV